MNEKDEPIVKNGKLALGNLNIARDWGYSPDFVDAMWKILQHNSPEDFIIGTGKLHTLKELCQIAYARVNKNWEDYIYSDQALMRPLETNVTVADAAKAYQKLDWKPSVDFTTMIEKMVDYQISKLTT